MKSPCGKDKSASKQFILFAEISRMEASLLIGLIVGYFALLIAISFISGSSDDHQAFFLGNRQSPWYAVAFGMVGASLSGVTFLSVPGLVEAGSFAYMQV
ncbi:MAG: hypothetical protein ACPGVV_09780, partial [Croceimicrobium sp.]